MIMDLLDEAVDYLRANDLITVPPVAAESLHMTMMSPRAQLRESVLHRRRGRSACRIPRTRWSTTRACRACAATIPASRTRRRIHEMIPGHHLLGYHGPRGSTTIGRLERRRTVLRRRLAAVLGAARSTTWASTRRPSRTIGALFWRMHRCARIIFSLKFHMGQWSPQEAIDFLVDRVGHERDNATAEVRRSFDPAAGYGPLYQAAYLLGGLQLRGLRKELVDTKIMTNTAVPRRDHASRRHAHRAAAAGREQPVEADPRHEHRLEVLWGCDEITVRGWLWTVRAWVFPLLAILAVLDDRLELAGSIIAEASGLPSADDAGRGCHGRGPVHVAARRAASLQG